MTVSTVVDHNDYTGNGVTTSFPYTFRIFKKTDLKVSVIDLSENITVLVLDTDYTVTNAGGYNGGSVVLTSPLADGWKITVARELAATQETDLRNQGKFFAEVHEDAFDKLTMLIQQVGTMFSLALRKPTSIANWHDALNNYIRNLKDPRDPQDAATKNYVDTLSTTNIGRTLRVPEQIPQLPNAAARANKMPAFDNLGNPIVVIPPSGSASDVLIELAKPTGAGLVGTSSGGTVQADIDKINKQNDSFAYIEDYANLAVGDDWSDAIQEALDTGKDVVGEKDKIYTVSKVLNSKGQQLLGGFKLNITRYSLGVIPANSFVKQNPDTRIMMCYVSSAYDMAEMLYIKSLGFNIIHHYLGFANSVDSAGTTAQMLDNAQSAGLKVSIGTEQDPLAISDLPAFIASVDTHPAVYMYAVYDEPGARGISITDQDAKISVLRGVTTKTLQMVCQLPPGGPFTQWYSTNYDLVFVDSYSTATTGTLQQRIDQDLIKMRLDFGVIQQMTGVKRTIPCIGTFLFSGSNISGDIDQVVGGCKVFGTAGNGEFAAFVWDGEADPGITSRLRTNDTLRKVIKDLASKVYYKHLDTKTYLFGGSGVSKHWPLQELLKDVMPADTSSSDQKITKNAWPTRIISGSGNGDHETTQAGVDVSGIAFKTSDAALCLSSRYSRGVGAWLEISNLNGGNPINGIFFMGKSIDGIRYEDIASVSLTSSQTFMFGFKPDDYSAIGTAPVIHFSFPAGTSPFYRAFMRGAIVLADW